MIEFLILIIIESVFSWLVSHGRAQHLLPEVCVVGDAGTLAQLSPPHLDPTLGSRSSQRSVPVP